MAETGPLFVSSGDLLADRRYNVAIELAARGDFAAAADILEQTIELAPRFATAWFALGAIRDRLGQSAGAVAAFTQARDADPQDYHGARLQLARLGEGESNPAMSETYVRRLFDQYAGRYDEALIEKLNYRGPAVLREAIAGVMQGSGRLMHFGAMLDLGCGTGLCGAALRPFVDRLVGVDLSPAMIAKAAAKGIYDRLCKATLSDFLAGAIAEAATYSLVVAADVFVYVNDLAPIVRAIARVLAPDGLLACTVESHTGSGVKLLPTLRFAYGEDHLRAIIEDAGLSLVTLSAASVRTENGVPVQGLVLVASAPDASDTAPIESNP